MLAPGDLLLVAKQIRDAFVIHDDFEFSIEIDPNDMTPDRYDGFGAAGVTRASIGVQDFDPRVQQAINRIQTMEQTQAVVDGVRSHGVRSVNLDVLYGLPFQTEASVMRTIEAVLAMHPSVRDAAVLGVPDPRWGETGVAFVVATGATQFDAGALLAHCTARLAKYKCPTRIVRIDAIPRSAAGKILKPLLRARFNTGEFT